MLHSCRGPKIGASIKLVSQKDGVDMDPYGTKFQPRGEGGPPGPGGRRAVGGHVGEAAGEQTRMKVQTIHWASIVARAGSLHMYVLHLFIYNTHHSMLRSTLL